MAYKNLPKNHQSYFDFTTLPDDEKGYWAGLLDGEGCLRFDKCSGKPLPAVSLWMTCESTIQRFADRFDLSVKKRSRNSMKDHHKDCYGAYMTTHKAAKLCEALLPWLWTKKAIGKEIAEYYVRTCESCNGSFWSFNNSSTCSEECYHAKKLNTDRLYREKIKKERSHF